MAVEETIRSTESHWLIGGMAGLVVVAVGLGVVQRLTESADDSARRHCHAAVRKVVREKVARSPAATAKMEAGHVRHLGNRILVDGEVDIKGVHFDNGFGSNQDIYNCEVVNGVVTYVDVSTGR